MVVSDKLFVGLSVVMSSSVLDEVVKSEDKISSGGADFVLTEDVVVNEGRREVLVVVVAAGLEL